DATPEFEPTQVPVRFEPNSHFSLPIANRPIGLDRWPQDLLSTLSWGPAAVAPVALLEQAAPLPHSFCIRQKQKTLKPQHTRSRPNVLCPFICSFPSKLRRVISFHDIDDIVTRYLILTGPRSLMAISLGAEDQGDTKAAGPISRR